MDALSNSTLTTATVAPNDTRRSTSHRWEFLVAVLATAILLSIIMAIVAKCQVIRHYLASYRHTRLSEADTHDQCEQSSGLEVEFDMHGECVMNPHRPVCAEDDDGFIEDNYIPASERERAEREAEDMEDTEEEIDEIEFTIA
ncbi:type III endosome membrane protein TEMP [Dunckerocampus dactyliophorus]|uniref:type III endosome membrane protein TEMP n=1 Tax=Dunckerocampus dactyliophorus TaxID=161453 RepID=UPI002406F6E3|nr:type III endosome membrane protein TEMP [Dunckerocampus dactyliophorus]XP_054646313.1 type III endosome membrane protein TEMP [Dunckerocampus dactyliophorus]